MTEEMIVNGVDVSECGFLDNHRPTKLLLCNECNSDFAAMECKDYHDCYYKQLKRLEQENAKLKDTTDGLLSIQYTLADNCNKYYKALEEIKKISKNAFAVCDDDCGNANKFMDIINKVSEVLKDD